MEAMIRLTFITPLAATDVRILSVINRTARVVYRTMNIVQTLMVFCSLMFVDDFLLFLYH